MTKRVFSLLLAAAMVLCMVPVAVSAEEAAVTHDPKHCLCGDGTDPNCSHEQIAWEAWGDDPTEKNTLPTDSGSYYLTENVALTTACAVSTNDDIHLCLNGHSVRVDYKTEGKVGDTVFYMTRNGKLTISDCTAKTEDGVYTAGILTGGTRGAISSNTVGGKAPENILVIYDGILTGNSNTANGGAVVLNEGTSSFTMYGGQLRLNEAAGNGGAVYAAAGSTVELVNTVITDNRAVSGGAIYAGGSCQVTLKNCQITNNTNTGTGGSAIHLASANNQLVLDGTTVTGNNSTGSYKWRGGIYVDSKLDRVTLRGKTVVSGNTVDDGATAADLVLVRSAGFVYADGLLSGSQVRINTPVAWNSSTGFQFADANDMVKLPEGAAKPAGWDYQNIIYANTGMAVDYNETEGFTFVVNTDHRHCLCGDGQDKNCDHAQLPWYAWEDTDKLPDGSGNYYLTEDVVLTTTSTVSTGDDIHLCLNGHSVRVDYATEGKASDTVFYMTRNGKLTISDCTAHTEADGTYVAGQLTGGTRGAISSNTVSKKTPENEISLYDGILTGNSNTANGGAVNLTAGTTVFTMYGGEIRGNTAAESGGAVSAAEGTRVVLLGGKISGNNAQNAGGVYASGAKVTLGGTVVENNTATTNGGGMILDDASQAVMTGGSISGNSAGNAGGVLIQSRSSLAMEGGTVSGNTAGKSGGGIYVSTGTSLELTGGTVTGNCAGTDGGGIYLLRQTTLTLGGGAVTKNTAGRNGGGVYVHAEAQTLSVTGAPVIRENSAAGVNNNLYLSAETKLDATAMTEGAQVSLTAEKLPRFVSGTIDPAYAGYFLCDSIYRTLEVKENKLYMGFSTEHGHCLCAGGDHCDHAEKTWVAWESATSLPTVSGSYYLLADVQLAAAATIPAGVQVELCLNGKTVTAAGSGDSDRIYILKAGSSLTIADCTAVTDSKGGYTAGKLTGANGAFSLENSATFNLYDGIITGNTREGNVGAAIALLTGAEGKQNTFNMYGGEISGNTAGSHGGAMYVRKNAVVNLYGGTIKNNVAAGYDGGAIKVIEGGTVNLYGTTLSGNTAKRYGGAISTTGGTLNISGGTITGSTARNGAGVHMNENSTLTMTGGTVSSNRISGVGGGIYLQYSQATLSGGTIENNKASHGGGIYSGGSAVTLSGVTLKNNTATENGGGMAAYRYETEAKEVIGSVATFSAGTVTGNSAKQGGGIFAHGIKTVLTMDGGTLSGNSATYGGGLMTLTNSTFVLKNGTIKNNRAEKDGGGAYISSNTSIQMSGGSITGNAAGKRGGGILLLRSPGTFSGGAISNNKAVSYGGGMHISGGKATLSGTSIQNNVSESNGGGICTGISSNSAPSITMTAGTISGNKGVHGGGLLVMGKGGSFTLKGGSISGNEASKNGGGMYISTGTTFTMTGGDVTGNQAASSGGGIFQLRSIGNIQGVTLHNNTAGAAGGALGISGDTAVVTLTDVTIRDNTAVNGGGAVIQSKGTLNMVGGQVSNNSSTNHGGGIYVSTLSFGNFTDTQFSKNTAGMNGGAVFAAQATNLTMKNATATVNSVDGQGGGIFLRGNLTITDSQVTDNTAKTSGGGIATGKMGYSGIGIQPGLVTENLLVENNTTDGQGGGIYLSIGSRCTLTDTTVQNNTAAQEGGGIWAVDDLTMDSLTVTKNRSGGAGWAVYLAPSRYDGHSYFAGIFKLSGDTRILDNEGGDLYLDEKTAMTVTVLGQDAQVNITLDSGLLTNRVYGTYHYEGGDQVYTITYGDRSATDPERNPAAEAATPEAAADAVLYAVVGAFALAVAAVVIWLLLKKKKASADKK